MKTYTFLTVEGVKYISAEDENAAVKALSTFHPELADTVIELIEGDES